MTDTRRTHVPADDVAGFLRSKILSVETALKANPDPELQSIGLGVLTELKERLGHIVGIQQLIKPTVSTDDVRESYAESRAHGDSKGADWNPDAPHDWQPYRAEFDIWLAQHDRELAAKLGWSPFGTHQDSDETLVFSENTEDGLPDWERPVW